MTGRRYAVYDVFTTECLAGNPLAVVFDSEGLDGEAMQAIAGEFNLSETAFVMPPANTMADVKLRIFTPKAELPFAGHPTVGSAIALAERDGKGGNRVIEMAAGLVPCSVAIDDGVPYAQFVAPRLPVEDAMALHSDVIAKAVNVEPFEVGFKGYGPALFNVPSPFVYLPVDGLEVIGNARPTPDLMRAGFPHNSIYLFTRRTVTGEAHFHARMFAPAHGIPEDPATGSATVGLAGMIMKFEQPTDGRHSYVIEQGFEMGRPSMLRLELTVADGALREVALGGNAVRVAEGMLLA